MGKSHRKRQRSILEQRSAMNVETSPFDSLKAGCCGLSPIALSIISAALLVLGFCLQIVACVIPDSNWYPMLGVLSYTIPPIPLFFLKNATDREALKWGEFVSGFMYLSVFGMPVCLIHGGLIGWLPFILSLVGSLVFIGGFHILFFSSTLLGKTDRSDGTEFGF